jgi:hypothetical protein
MLALPFKYYAPFVDGFYAFSNYHPSSADYLFPSLLSNSQSELRPINSNQKLQVVFSMELMEGRTAS